MENPCLVVCTRTAEIHHVPITPLYLGQKRVLFLQFQKHPAQAIPANHKNRNHFTVPPRTNTPRTSEQRSCAPHQVSTAFAAEQGFLFGVTFCRRCGAQLASHKHITQLLGVKARSATCYSSAVTSTCGSSYGICSSGVLEAASNTQVGTRSLQNATQRKGGE